MICKQCGAEMAPSANKCKRCGTRVPAKSNCGGFYDLASAGTKLWEDSKAAPAAPAPVYRDTPAPTPVHRTKPFIILAAVAVLLAIALVVTLVVKFSADDGQVFVPATTTATDPSADTPTEPDGNTGIDGVPAFGAANTTITIYNDGYKVTSDAPSLVYPYIPDLEYRYSWTWDETDPENYVVLNVDVQVDDTIFGAVETFTLEDGTTTENIEYFWETVQNKEKAKYRELGATTAPFYVFERDNRLSETSFRFTMTRTNVYGGTLTVIIEDISYPTEGVPVPEPEAPANPENGSDDQVSADVFE